MRAPSAVAVALMVALFFFAAFTTAVVTAEQERLAWRDSGYDLAAGYRYTIVLRSGRVWTGWCARAMFDATVIKAELSGSHLKVWIAGSVAHDGDVGSDSATLTIVVDQGGSGSVDLSARGRIGGFSLDQSYRIMVYTETVSAWPTTATSEVQISRQRLSTPTPTPTPTPDASEVNLVAMLGGGAATALTIVLVLLGVLLVLYLLARAGGARKLVRKAVG